MGKKKKKGLKIDESKLETKKTEGKETSVSSDVQELIEEPNKMEEPKEGKEEQVVEEMKEDVAISSESHDDVEEDISEVMVEKTEEPTTSSQEEKIVEASPTSKKSYKTAIILSISFAVIVLLFLLFSTIFALVYGSKTTIIDRVHIKGIDVSSLTREQALEKVLQTFQNKLEQPITLKHNEYETTVFARTV